LAGDNTSVKGFAFYYFCFSSFRGRPSLWLDDLYVHAADRRHGVGLRLMRRLGEIATALECTHIAWLASASNTAGMSFYRKLGASVVQQIDDAVTLRIAPSALVASIENDCS
jgi:GNAT superfamily N-acetyltransferase